MKAKNTRTFIGDGVNLWPSQYVTGALNLVFLVYDNHQDFRDVGDLLVNVHDTVQGSQLARLILAISTNPALATGAAVASAVTELIGVICKIMKNDKDDYVDLFEGSYGTDKRQTARNEKYDNEESGIELDFTVS
jgi:hypothetical protein